MLPDGSDRVSSTPKQQLFDALRLRLGDYLQVEELSSDLELSGGLTRGLLDELSADGAELEHHPGLGYRLGGIADQLLQVEIHYELETQTLGRDLVVRERVESTNDVARELVKTGAGEGTLVVADVQSAGRGRRGRAWFSPPGAGLWCSLVLAAPRDGPDPGFLTLLLGAAIARALKEEVPQFNVDIDEVIAGGLCHDLGKAWEYDPHNRERWEADHRITGMPSLRHPLFGVHVALSAGLPEQIAHIAGTHSAEGEHITRRTGQMGIATFVPPDGGVTQRRELNRW